MDKDVEALESSRIDLSEAQSNNQALAKQLNTVKANFAAEMVKIKE